MNKQLVITGAQVKYFKTDFRAGSISLVCVPASATYSVAYTCTPHSFADSAKNWVAISAGLTGATTSQTAETGSITGLRFTLTSGTSLTVDMCQAEA